MGFCHRIDQLKYLALFWYITILIHDCNWEGTWKNEKGPKERLEAVVTELKLQKKILAKELENVGN